MSFLVNQHERKIPRGTKRSDKWPALRKAFLKGKVCAVCGGAKKLEAHHIRPFHLHPELELDETNLIALCENKGDGINCHLFVGHLGSFQSFNASVRDDARDWQQRLIHRPTREGMGT